MTVRAATAILVFSMMIVLNGSAAWCDSDKAPATAAPAAGTVGETNPLALLILSIQNPEHHDTPKNCSKQGIYSSHDVVGDPEACFMGRISGSVPQVGGVF